MTGAFLIQYFMQKYLRELSALAAFLTAFHEFTLSGATDVSKEAFSCCSCNLTGTGIVLKHHNTSGCSMTSDNAAYVSSTGDIA